MYEMKPIGYVRTCYHAKNGIPRQASLSQEAKATLQIEKSIFTNPDHSVMGLEEFSYIWVIFIFHENRKSSHVKAKVHPPRLDGKAVGVFSTRSPHRPNPVGLSLVRLEKIEGYTLHLAGVDLLDGTPIIDIKPYIPSYDCPAVGNVTSSSEVSVARESFHQHKGNQQLVASETASDQPADDQTVANYEAILVEEESPSSAHHTTMQNCADVSNDHPAKMCKMLVENDKEESHEVKMPMWLNSPPIAELSVIFTSRAEGDLSRFHGRNTHDKRCSHCLDSLQNPNELKSMITKTLENDPRSVYRRNKCQDRLYYYFFDNVHVTSWFDDNVSVVEVLHVLPLNRIEKVS